MPSPLYVEYQYGDIVDKITNSAGKEKFTETAQWVSKAASNQYGSGEMQTANTQHKYSYQAGLSDENAAAEAAKWKHTAGDITPEAESAALEAGYTFAGWKAEYYPECTESNGSGTNNKTYHFSGNLYAQTNYDAGDSVTLYTHVKLIAQWKKVEGGAVKVTKTVTGDEIDANKEFTFTAKLKKDGVQISFPASAVLSGAVTQEKNGNDWSFTLKHNGSATFSNLPLGSVLEVEERSDSDYKTTINGVEKRSHSVTVTSGKRFLLISRMSCLIKRLILQSVMNLV